MKKDPTQFRDRFKRWKEGLPPYKNGKPIEDEEWDPNDTYTADAGMIKSKLAIASHFGNPTARRMTNYDGRDYTWPGEYEYIDGIGEPKRGNVYVSSYDNLVTPLIQDNGKTLEFVDDLWNSKNEKRSYKQSLKFNKMRDAWSFGENYKKYAPMMNRYRHGKDGDTIDGGTPFEITVTAKDRRPAWKRMYQNKHLGDTSLYYDKDALHEALSFAPVVGDAVDAVDFAKAIQDKNYTTAGLLGAGLLLPNVIEKPVKAAYRGAKLLWNGGKIIQKNIPIKPGNFYRTVSKEAIDDAVNTGVVRGSKQYKNTPYFSYDDILILPRGKAGYVIEGTAETPVRWTSPYMKDTYTPIELLGDANFANSVPEDFLQVRAPYTAGEAIPWFNGSTQVPTTGFNYWLKYPIIGWRLKSFDVTRP